MTRTEERLTDALDTAARAIDEDTLHPLQLQERRRRLPAWAAPVAAAASVFLVVGLAAALAAPRPGLGGTPSGSSPAALAAPDRYYVEEDFNPGRAVVRSAVTGAVTATLPLQNGFSAPGWDVFASAADGAFFAAGWVPGAKGEQLYRFRITAAGQVSGFSAVPGGVLAGGRWSADAIAASPDGSQVAIAFDPTGMTESCSGYTGPSCQRTLPSDDIVVVNTATGKKSEWQGWKSDPGTQFNVDNLSWADDGHELVFFGEQCAPGGWMGTEICGHGRQAEARTLDPGSGGGRLDSGRLLFRESATYIAQAVISPDGSTMTEVVLTGPVIGTTNFPQNLSVEQISLATGKLLRVLYRRNGYAAKAKDVPDPLLLVPDGADQHWLLDVGFGGGNEPGFNGWIGQRTLVPLKPADGALAYEAW